MKLKVTICLICIAIAFLSYFSGSNFNASAFPNGINGFSGSPTTNGNNCSSCHVVRHYQQNENFEIRSTIPETGFVPNSTYDFTISIKSKFEKTGFNLRFENESGQIVGLISNKDSLSRLEMGELTHSTFTKIANGLGIYKFTWTAPEKDELVELFAAIGTISQPNSEIDTLNLLNFTFRKDITTYLDGNSDAFLLNNAFHYSVEGGHLRIHYVLSEDAYVSISVINSIGIEYGILQNALNRKGINSVEIPWQYKLHGLSVLKLNIGQSILTKKIYIEK